MDPLETLEGPHGVPELQFGKQSWTHWKPLKDLLASLNHSLGISHGPTGKPSGTTWGPRTLVWEPVMDPLETLEGPLGVPEPY